MIWVLFIIRVASALLLLGFVGTIAYMISRDMTLTSRQLSEKKQDYGRLSVISTDSERVTVGESWSLRMVTSVGRGPANLVVLKDEFTSVEHLLINRRGPQWWVEDLNSSNGTLLNGIPLKHPTVISAGDIIQIGSTNIRIDIELNGKL